MKKILIIPAIAALTLCACGGNTNQNNNSDGTDTSNGTDAINRVSTDADAIDTISTKIWEALKAFDKKLKERVDEVYNTSWCENPTEKATSKTTYEFTWIYHTEEGGFEAQYGAKLGCFPMLDKSWVAVMVPANIYEHNDIRAYNYSNGKVSNADLQKLFPEGFEITVEGGLLKPLEDFRFDAATMSVEHSAEWPAKYEWKGSEFRPVQPFYEQYTVDMSDGSFNRIGKNSIRIHSAVDDIEQDGDDHRRARVLHADKPALEHIESEGGGCCPDADIEVSECQCDKLWTSVDEAPCQLGYGHLQYQ